MLILKNNEEKVITMIDLSSKDKAEVLAKLYNASKPLGMGFLQADGNDMTTEEARKLLDDGQTYFDYLKGRVMKVDLSGDKLDPRLYDRDNGQGAAAAAIDG
jgi:hypothetical protein